MYSAPSQKPTRVVGTVKNLLSLHRTCIHSKHSKVLEGRTQDGMFATTSSANYPSELSKCLAHLHINHFLEETNKDPVDGKELLEELKLCNGKVVTFRGDRIPVPPISVSWDSQVFEEVFRVTWTRTEPSNIVEARQILLTIRHVVRNSQNWNKRVLLATDNLCALACLSKGRSSSRPLLLICRKVAALCMTFGITLLLRWVPTKRNFADGPSRGRSIVVVENPQSAKSYHG